MTKKWIGYLISIFILALSIAAFSFLQSAIDKTSLLMAFDKILINIISSVWVFITVPTVFISILITFLLWKYQIEILALVPTLKELKAGSISATFENAQFPSDKPVILSPTIKEENRSTANLDNKVSALDEKDIMELLSKTFGKLTSEFILNLDNKILHVNEIIELYKGHFKETEWAKWAMNKTEQEQYMYNYGRYSAFMTYTGYKFLTSAISEDKKTAHFFLKPHAEKILKARLDVIDKSVSKQEQ